MNSNFITSRPVCWQRRPRAEFDLVFFFFFFLFFFFFFFVFFKKRANFEEKVYATKINKNYPA